MRLSTLLVCSACVMVALTSLNLGAATFTVSNTNDAGPNSLRQAITMANIGLGPDTVAFNIPGAGPHTIFPLSQLPQLVDPTGLLIDGLTEPSATPGSNPPSTANLMIVVDGLNAGQAHGLWIVTPNNTIRGLVVNNFEQDGIRIEGTYDGTFLNQVFCNFIGTDQTGTIAQGNGGNTFMLWAGVDIIVTQTTPGFAYHNMVNANLVSANYAEGVSISNCPPGDVYLNMVMANYIGTDRSGLVDLGNAHDGVYIGEGAHDNAVSGNLISGNDFEGVCIVGYAENRIVSYGNAVVDNIIGIDLSQAPLPNASDGVSIGVYGANQSPAWYAGGHAVANLVMGNVIGWNGRNGVLVWEHSSSPFNADMNQVSTNSIYENGLLGIDLGDNGTTANDPADPDAGPNQELNFPVILTADYTGGFTAVTGALDIDTDPAQAVIEIFRARIDPTGYGEGEIFLGTATPNPVGDWTAVVTGVVPGDYVTATATDSSRNTSEFSSNVQVLLVGVEEKFAGRTRIYGLAQNCPNPFSHSTSLGYVVPERTLLSLKVYDVCGKLVKVLAEGLHHPSSYTATWDGRDSQGVCVPAGVYLYRLEAQNFTSTRPMTLIR